MPTDVYIERTNYVALVEFRRPPHNFFDLALVRDLADAFESLDRDKTCRALVLASQGTSFCAGANFHSSDTGERRGGDANPLYAEAVRLFACKKPVVAAIQGAAIGGGFGLALTADFRVVAREARFAANFVKLGIHPGFGLTYTLPRLIGQQRASLLFLTGRRIDGETAVAWGLADQLAPADGLRDAALALAAEIAEGAPLAVQATRATLRRDLAAAVKAQTDHEHIEQRKLFGTKDHAEGVQAVKERRAGRFIGE
jgi:enoyl-CoA hydratase/carnithine racemase